MAQAIGRGYELLKGDFNPHEIIPTFKAFKAKYGL